MVSVTSPFGIKCCVTVIIEHIMVAVHKPTYEIVGPVERFDERDTVFAREALIPGSREEIRYHQLKPHLKEIDGQLSRFIDGKLDRSSATWGRAYYQAGFGSIAHLGLPDCVDGQAAPGALDLNEQQNSMLVKGLAGFLGADVVGIGPLRPEWVYSHKGSRPFFESQSANPPLFEGMPAHYAGRLWGDPIRLSHRNTIALGFAQNLDALKAGPSEVSDLEVGRVYAESALVACELASFIRSLGYPARAHHVRNYCVMVVPVAVDAGLGELARSGHLLHTIYGLNLRLSCVTTDMPLEHDEPVDIGVQAFCDRCLKCAKNCPVGAIPLGDKTAVRGVKKWQMEPEKCLSYWSKVEAACLICQVVCPWSKPPSLFHKTIAHIASMAGWMTRPLVFGDDIFYGKKYKQRHKPDWMP
jgi:reductive dehalogenase